MHVFSLNYQITARWGKLSGLSKSLLGSLFIALCAQISIPLPFNCVPLTLQTFGVFIVAACLGKNCGTASVLLYLAEGALGCPFFAGGGCGIAALLGPKAGYIVGFVLASYFIGSIFSQTHSSMIKTLLLFMVADLLILTCGSLHLASFIGGKQALVLGVAPFLAADALKAFMASCLLVRKP